MVGMQLVNFAFFIRLNCMKEFAYGIEEFGVKMFIDNTK